MTATTSRSDLGTLGPTHAEVAYAFMTDSLALSREQRAQLRRLGVSEAVIDHDPGYESAPIRAASVIFSARFFDFAAEGDADAAPVFVACARDWRGNANDMIAFDLDGRLAASWLGREALLGAHHVFAPRFDDPLRVFDSPFSWLRGDRDGIVIIDWTRAAAALEGITLTVDHVDFGKRLRQRLTRPPPPIVLRRKARVAA
jgi:hypothetical protein